MCHQIKILILMIGLSRVAGASHIANKPISMNVYSSSPSVILSWNNETVSSFNVYRSLTSGGAYTKINKIPIITNSYTDSTVTINNVYYYVVTAVGSTGLESAYSTQVSGSLK